MQLCVCRLVIDKEDQFALDIFMYVYIYMCVCVCLSLSLSMFTSEWRPINIPNGKFKYGSHKMQTASQPAFTPPIAAFTPSTTLVDRQRGDERRRAYRVRAFQTTNDLQCTKTTSTTTTAADGDKNSKQRLRDSSCFCCN